MVYNSVEGLIGNTPLLQLKKLQEKLEEKKNSLIDYKWLNILLSSR